MPTVSKILDRVVSDPVVIRRLKGKSGRFKIRANGKEVGVAYEKSDAGYFTFTPDVPEETKL
jgi:hypothetical protein